VAIISGLTLSSFLTLVVVPVVYSKVEETADALHRWVSRIRGNDVAGA
jgi:hypothetical protein